MSLILLAAAALGIADPDTIDRAIGEFISAADPASGVAAQPIDRRLRLRSCDAPLALSWRMPRRDAVLVRCPDPGSWRLFVPLRVAPAAPSTDIAAPAAPVIARGDAVTLMIAGDGFSVSRSGEAMEAGAPGAWIKVRIAAAPGAQADPLRAQVVRPGLVTIPMP